MNFTGINLWRVRKAVILALDEIQYQIGGCPDVELYSEEIADLEEDRADFLRMLRRIETALDKERALETNP